jgi:hypothetical protein
MIQWMDHQMKSCQQRPHGRQAWVRKEIGIVISAECYTFKHLNLHMLSF